MARIYPYPFYSIALLMSIYDHPNYFHKDRGQLRTRSVVYNSVFFCYSYCMDRLDFPKVRRDAFTVASAFEKSGEKSYWLSRTPHERLEAVELMRQIIYGYDPSAIRLQRVLEVTQRSSG